MVKLLKDSRKKRFNSDSYTIQEKADNNTNEADLEIIGNSYDFVALIQEDHKLKKSIGDQ